MHFNSKIPKDYLWFPVNAISMYQVVFQEDKESYYVPSLTKIDHNNILKKTHDKTHGFLKELWENDSKMNFTLKYFPLEYFWWRTWIGCFRMIAYCSSLLNKYDVGKIIIIDRIEYSVEGGLLINNNSFIRLICNYFKYKNIAVELISANKKTISKS